MNELADRLATAEHGYIVERTGLKVLRQLTPAEWEACGRDLGSRYASVNWAIGDWMILGEGLQVDGRRQRWESADGKPRSMYDVAIELTGLAYETVAELARTAKAFPPAGRRVDLPWSHYRVAKGAPGGSDGALKVLRESQRRHWNVRQLTSHVAQLNAAADPVRAFARRRTKARPDSHVCCPRCELVFAIKGHRVKPSSSVSAESGKRTQPQ